MAIFIVGLIKYVLKKLRKAVKTVADMLYAATTSLKTSLINVNIPILNTLSSHEATIPKNNKVAYMVSENLFCVLSN